MHATKTRRVSRSKPLGENGAEKVIRIAVVDLDKAKTYPLNFVSKFPKEPRSHSVFKARFGNKSTELAKQLLEEALQRELDEDVRREFERRLKLLY